MKENLPSQSYASVHPRPRMLSKLPHNSSSESMHTGQSASSTTLRQWMVMNESHLWQCHRVAHSSCRFTALPVVPRINIQDRQFFAPAILVGRVTAPTVTSYRCTAWGAERHLKIAHAIYCGATRPSNGVIPIRRPCTTSTARSG